MFCRMFIAAVAMVSCVVVTQPSMAAETVGRVSSECGQCHQLQGPASKNIEERAKRKGPPLFYAGNKFREAWLVKWLQAPTRIRPAGDFPPAHVKTTPKGDIVDDSTLVKHPVLDNKSAIEIAAYLMKLTAFSDLISKETYTPGTVSERMGAMDFNKFKGCGACHQDSKKEGGVSGPELYTGWQRLNPAFIVSYTRNPTAWDPTSIMPVKGLKDTQIRKLVDYLHVIGEKQGRP